MGLHHFSRKQGRLKTYRAFIGLLEAVILFFTMKSTLSGAPGGTRTPTPLREADFESAASTVPPQRHLCEATRSQRSADIAYVRLGFNGFGDVCAIDREKGSANQAKEGEARRKIPLGFGRSEYSAALIAGNATPEAAAISVLRSKYCEIANVLCENGENPDETVNSRLRRRRFFRF